MSTLNQFLEQVRRDLGDTIPANARWSSEDLERHLYHALQELSLAIPLQQVTTFTTTAGSRDLTISSLASRISVEAVEYPTGNYPPTYARFSLWADILTLLVDGTPAAGETVKVYWTAMQALDQGGTTVPLWAEHLLPLGAVGYAALEWATYAINRINTGGEETGRDYLTLGQQRLAAFYSELARLGRQRTLRARRFYVPAQPKPSQSTDWGP